MQRGTSGRGGLEDPSSSRRRVAVECQTRVNAIDKPHGPAARPSSSCYSVTCLCSSLCSLSDLPMCWARIDAVMLGGSRWTDTAASSCFSRRPSPSACVVSTPSVKHQSGPSHAEPAFRCSFLGAGQLYTLAMPLWPSSFCFGAVLRSGPVQSASALPDSSVTNPRCPSIAPNAQHLHRRICKPEAVTRQTLLLRLRSSI